MNVYTITSDYDVLAYFVNLNEAEQYLNDIRKIDPENTYELEIHKCGRPKGHDEPIWAMEGVMDLLDGSLHMVNRNWFWKSVQVIEIEPGIRSKFIGVYGKSSEQAQFEKEMKSKYKSLLNKYRIIAIGTDTIEVQLRDINSSVN